jgi:hypothetical protein
MSRFALIAATLAMVACSQPRVLQIQYTKAQVSDVAASEDKAAFRSTKGVTNVVLDSARDGSVNLQVFVEDGKETAVYQKAEELGYTRLK